VRSNVERIDSLAAYRKEASTEALEKMYCRGFGAIERNISARVCGSLKHRRMHWTPAGAHNVAQVRMASANRPKQRLSNNLNERTSIEPQGPHLRNAPALGFELTSIVAISYSPKLAFQVSNWTGPVMNVTKGLFMNTLRRSTWIGRRTLTIGILVAVAGAFAACEYEPAMSSDTGPQQPVAPIVSYLKDTWGISIVVLESSGVDEQDDGTLTTEALVRIHVDGLGAKELATNTVIISDEFGNNTSFFVSRPDGTDERYFLYDLENRYVTIGNAIDDKSVIVSANGDGTYQVDTALGEEWTTIATSVSGAEAMRTVAKYNEYTSIPPHVLLTAFAVAHTPTSLDTRNPINCNDNTVMNQHTAAPPAVCGIFKEFCDCAACLVLDRPGACDACAGQ
jgi:hypothetical protein